MVKGKVPVWSNHERIPSSSPPILSRISLRMTIVVGLRLDARSRLQLPPIASCQCRPTRCWCSWDATSTRQGQRHLDPILFRGRTSRRVVVGDRPGTQSPHRGASAAARRRSSQPLLMMTSFSTNAIHSVSAPSAPRLRASLEARKRFRRTTRTRPLAESPRSRAVATGRGACPSTKTIRWRRSVRASNVSRVAGVLAAPPVTCDYDNRCGRCGRHEAKVNITAFVPVTAQTVARLSPRIRLPTYRTYVRGVGFSAPTTRCRDIHKASLTTVSRSFQSPDASSMRAGGPHRSTA